MSKANFSDDFKREAVHQNVQRGYPVAEVSKRLGVSPHSPMRGRRGLRSHALGTGLSMNRLPKSDG
jgi:transposase-like protein